MHLTFGRRRRRRQQNKLTQQKTTEMETLIPAEQKPR